MRCRPHASQLLSALLQVADWYPTICTLAGVVDCTDNQTFLGAIRPIDGKDAWPRLIAPSQPQPPQPPPSAVAARLPPYHHEWLPLSE
jgi:hypothetical protein